MADEEDSQRVQRGIQSIEVGGQLLQALVHQGRPMTLGDLAREADMVPAKAHPYLVSFGRLGLIERDPFSGQYMLGPLALQLGLIALQQNNPVQIASPLIETLATRIGQTVAIAVWGDRGATIVRLAESPAAIHVVMRHGTVFSLTSTATGRMFGANMDSSIVKRLLEDERDRRKRSDYIQSSPPAGMPSPPPIPAWKSFEAELQLVKKRGLSRSEGETVPGVSAMSAPVFDHTGSIALAITAIGASGVFDSAWDGDLARELKRCAQEISARLGKPAS